MRDSVCCAIFVLVVTLMLIGCGERGVVASQCRDKSTTCWCGNPNAGRKVRIPIKQCPYYDSRYRRKCRACQAYDKAALCRQFRYCRTCNARRKACATCPAGRHGSSCKAVRSCGRPPSLRNGRWVGTKWTEGRVVRYFCNDRWALSGDSSLTCRSGQWKGTRPRCIRSCGQPHNLRNGRWEGKKWTEGGVVRYFCDAGWVLSGDSSRKCRNGRWTRAVHKCIRSCGGPPNVHNGHWVGRKWTEGGVVRYFCDAGWTMSGDSSITCRNGQWKGTMHKCRQVTCSKPAISNSVLTPHSDTYVVGGVVSVSCLSGFSLDGASSITCQQNGDWNTDEPRCSAITTTQTPVTCPTPNPPKDGDVTAPGSSGVFRPGESINFSCKDGFLLAGHSRLICKDNGSWHGTPGRCVQVITCEDLETPPNAIRTVHQPRAIRRGPLRRFRVPYGKKSATVGRNGDPSSLPPGRVKVRTRITFKCESDLYELIGSQHRECQMNGQWSGQQPTCTPSQVPCPKPAISNSVLAPNSDTYDVGTVVSVSCSSGFSLDGASSITCQDSGVWNTALPKCSVITTTQTVTTCPTLNAPINGDATAPGSSGVFLPGESINFSCKNGFSLAGQSSLICQADGTWTGTAGSCIQVITCPDLDTPRNAIRTVHQPPANRGLRFSRQRGFRRRNSATAGRSGNPADINLSPGRVKVGTKITFECESRFYKLSGPRHRECQLNGQWSGRQPTCIPVCGKSDGVRAPMIHNGEVSLKGEWPWQASLARRQANGTFVSVCGGTLVTESWIVTAAHCVWNDTASQIIRLSDVKVYLGMYFRDVRRHDSLVQLIDVSEIHVHPNYDPVDLDSDIAMIRLFQPATFTNRVSPACLASVQNDGASFLDQLIQPGLSVTVTGWGETENNTDANVLMKTQMGIISSRDCEEKYARTGLSLVVTSNMFCAGHDDGRSDTCFGDSGGPAVAPFGTGDNKKWYLVGLTSWGSPHGCSLPMQYSGFTRMSRFLSFVNQFTGL